MTDENPIQTDEDPIEGDAPEPGKREGAGLPDEGIEGKDEGGKTGKGEAGPASGTTESEGGPGLM
jgi:hypothetical protein